MIKLSTVFFALAFTLIACSNDDNIESLPEDFRAIHLSFGTGSLGVLVNDLPLDGSIDFTNSTDFVLAPEETFNVKVSTTASPDVFLIDVDFDPVDDPTTVYIFDEGVGLRNVRPIVLTNSFNTIDGSSIVRFLHANPDTFFTIDMYIGQSTEGCTDFSESTSYQVDYAEVANGGQYLAPLLEGNYDICITEADSPTALLGYLLDYSLEAETKQTISFIEGDFNSFNSYGFHIISDISNADAKVLRSELPLQLALQI